MTLRLNSGCTPEALQLVAGIKLSLARMLQRDIERGADFISNFNCARADGSTIVKGCSLAQWQLNHDRLVAEAEELAGGKLGI